jgi:hypothetical protein
VAYAEIFGRLLVWRSRARNRGRTSIRVCIGSRETSKTPYRDHVSEGADMIPLPTWMRRALFTTAGMNIGVAATFIPAAEPLRTAAGFPEGGHPLYLLTIGLFILLFGLGYLWCASAGRAERLFIALGALGKLSFFALLVRFWAVGALPLRAPVLGTADLVFGAMFLVWLVSARAPTAVPHGTHPAGPVVNVVTIRGSGDIKETG